MNGLINEQMQAQAADPQADQYLEAAIKFIQQKVYDESISAEIAKLAKAQPINEGALASLVYRLAEAADEATEGNVAEEDLSGLAIAAANEVFEILEAAGLDAPEALISKVMKQVALIFAQENDLDPAPLVEAFAQVNDDEMGAYASQVDEAML